MKNILIIELKNIFRSNVLRLGILTVFLFGVYGIFYGDRVIEAQRENISRVEQLENEGIEHILHLAKDDHTAGTQLYYMLFHTYNPPSEWAAFTLGQRDVLNYNIKMKILALEGQIYDNELTNPLSLLVGNLDLSFVFIYLFPLLIIALGFNLISEEKESGVWVMIRTTGISVLKFTFYKLLVRWVLVITLMSVLLLLALFIFDAGFGWEFLAIWGGSLVYVSFWFGILWLVNAFNKNSNINATLLVSVWIIVCLLIPALGNTIINTTTPIHEAMETTLIQREAYHEKWDMKKSVTMDKFYKEYPEYQKYKISEEAYYVAGWYFAMQYVADKEAEPTSQQMEQKLIERQNKAEIFGNFLPTVGVQRLYQSLAKTDLETHLEYLKSVRKHHKAIREYFYPYVFKETLTKDTPWENRPKFILPKINSEIGVLSLVMSVLYVLVFALLGIILIKKNQ